MEFLLALLRDYFSLPVFAAAMYVSLKVSAIVLGDVVESLIRRQPLGAGAPLLIALVMNTICYYVYQIGEWVAVHVGISVQISAVLVFFTLLYSIFLNEEGEASFITSRANA